MIGRLLMTCVLIGLPIGANAGTSLAPEVGWAGCPQMSISKTRTEP